MNRKSSRSAARRFQSEQLEPRVVLSSFTVSPTGNDANPGTALAPFLTLQKAANVVSPGDTVTVNAGTYKGFNLTTSGTATARITYNALPGAVINQPNAWNGKDGINLEGASNVTIQGFKVTGAPRAGIRVTGASNDVIQNNVTDQNTYWGIYASRVTNIDIERNTTSRSVKEHGIYVANSSVTPVIKFNSVWGNYSCGIHMNGDASQGGTGVITGADVECNTIYDNGTGGGSAINADGVQSSIISNNLLYNNRSSGISLFRMCASAGSTNDLVNNTIVQPAGSRWAVSINNGSTGTQLFNNILLNSDSYRGSVYVATDSLAGLKSDYNIGSVFSTDVNYYKTPSAWQAATGQDLHSFTAAATSVFTSVANNDYTLAPSSPALNKGIALSSSVATDIRGKVRLLTSPWSLGAYSMIV